MVAHPARGGKCLGGADRAPQLPQGLVLVERSNLIASMPTARALDVGLEIVEEDGFVGGHAQRSCHPVGGLISSTPPMSTITARIATP